MAKSCGGHIQSIPHVIQAVANLSSYSLGSQSGSILYGDSSPQLLLDFEIKCDTVYHKWQLPGAMAKNAWAMACSGTLSSRVVLPGTDTVPGTGSGTGTLGARVPTRYFMY